MVRKASNGYVVTPVSPFLGSKNADYVASNLGAVREILAMEFGEEPEERIHSTIETGEPTRFTCNGRTVSVHFAGRQIRVEMGA